MSAETIRPDVCLLDVVMPKVFGYELGQSIISTLDYLPLMIAMAGRGEPLDFACSTVFGFARHFVKPLDIEELLHFMAE